MRFQVDSIPGVLAAPALALALAAAPAQAQSNIVQTAVANGNFTTLVAAL
jgi:uncharacterized surface protein with fasciclin (FAS1) repeats